jgi:large subunit ribosomal protein L4
MKGKSVGDVEITDDLLVLDRGRQAVHDVVVALQNARRAGTASTLRKGEVAGSNKKPWRQKGTGRARAGLRQSPVWRGGGVAFGPHPRSFEQKINRKVSKLAFQRALSDKIVAGEIKVVDTLDLGEAKTRAVAAFLKAIGLKTPALIVLERVNRNMALASRNVAGLEVVSADSVNVYHLLRYPVVLADRAGLDRLTNRLKGLGEKAA